MFACVSQQSTIIVVRVSAGGSYVSLQATIIVVRVSAGISYCFALLWRIEARQSPSPRLFRRQSALGFQFFSLW